MSLSIKFVIGMEQVLSVKFCRWNGIGFEHEILSLEWNRFLSMKFCRWNGIGF